MSFSFGKSLSMHVFGESHGELVGVVVEGFPPGIRIDENKIQNELDKRRPGGSKLVTTRSEGDILKISSGVLEGISTGAPISMTIINQDARSDTYEGFKNVPRPGHADYPATIKYNGYNDIRGSGIFSGRMTAAFVMAGSLARTLLEKRGISIFAHIVQIGEVKAKKISKTDNINMESLDKRLVCADIRTGKKMAELINNVWEEGDSIGSKIECIVEGVPSGIGEPMFDSVESVLSHAMFSIPSIKSISFGSGADCASMRGSEFNDDYIYENGKIKTKSNHNGGIVGGLSNGMPIVFHVTSKPTPSISKTQDTIDLKKHKNCKINIQGRHDPCIGIRALPVVENMTAFCLADFIMRCEKWTS